MSYMSNSIACLTEDRYQDLKRVMEAFSQKHSDFQWPDACNKDNLESITKNCIRKFQALNKQTLSLICDHIESFVILKTSLPKQGQLKGASDCVGTASTNDSASLRINPFLSEETGLDCFEERIQGFALKRYRLRKDRKQDDSKADDHQQRPLPLDLLQNILGVCISEHRLQRSQRVDGLMSIGWMWTQIKVPACMLYKGLMQGQSPGFCNRTQILNSFQETRTIFLDMIKEVNKIIPKNFGDMRDFFNEYEGMISSMICIIDSMEKYVELSEAEAVERVS